MLSRALSAGARFIQYRNKSASRKELYEKSLRLVQMTKQKEAVFIVNDHADVAAAVDANGVHLGQEDLPIEHARKVLGNEKIIGVSTHDIDQAVAAQEGGADYIGFGPVFETGTKNAGPRKGIEQLSLVRKAVSILVIAIGGITLENVADVISSGADGVAVISAILSSGDIKKTTEEMIRRIQNSRMKYKGLNDHKIDTH